MRTLRRKIELKDGVTVETLFTPHLFSFKDEFGLTLEAEGDNVMQAMEVYADILFLAALNAWLLDGHGGPETFPWTRGDFHEYMAMDARRFAGDVAFAIEALTGKKPSELSKEGENKTVPSDKNKKKVLPRIGKRSRPSS